MKKTQNWVLGDTCRQCGGAQRYVKSGNCVACVKAAAKRSRQALLDLGALAHLPPDAYPVGRRAAIAMRVRRYYPEDCCKRGHMSLRDTRTGACSGCRDRRPGLSLAQRKARGPSLAFRDYRARETAREEGETIYVSARPCRHGHAAGRYVSSNGCVACAGSSSRKRYALLKKEKVRVAAAEAPYRAIEDLFSDENNPD